MFREIYICITIVYTADSIGCMLVEGFNPCYTASSSTYNHSLYCKTYPHWHTQYFFFSFSFWNHAGENENKAIL